MELVVLSGKGGTGKTTIATALSELVENVVKVDCDVDAPNLYLFYKGNDLDKEGFSGGKKAKINMDLCTKCGICETHCKFAAIEQCNINDLSCEGCGTCVLLCPEKAITLIDEKTADMLITQTESGIISRAEMEIGSEGSGKLVAALRKKAREYTEEDALTIIDGSPGIGCAVISSITGSNAALITVESTKSGFEDFKRVTALCKQFGILTLVCINKYDINVEILKEIEEFCLEENLKIVGKIPYDDTVIKSINELKPIIYYKNSAANKAIRVMWEQIKNYIYRRNLNENSSCM